MTKLAEEKDEGDESVLNKVWWSLMIECVKNAEDVNFIQETEALKRETKKICSDALNNLLKCSPKKNLKV